MCFHRKSLSRQIRILGSASLVSETEADDYFQSRPHGSKIGAWASDQSSILNKIKQSQSQYSDKNVYNNIDHILKELLDEKN